MSIRAATYIWNMIAGDDELRIFTLYEDAAKTTPVDLTGATAVAQGKNDSGTIVWTDAAVVVGDALGTLSVTVPLATTATKIGESGTWKIQVTWVDTSKWSPVYGTFKITPRSIIP